MTLRRWWPYVKGGTSIALLMIAARYLDTRMLMQTLAKAQWTWLAVAYSLTLLTIVLRAYKWQLLLSLQGVAVPLGTLSSFCLVGTFFNSFLPTGVGGDVARAYDLSTYTKKMRESISSVIWDRVTGLVALFLLALFAWGLTVNRSAVLPSSTFWWLMTPLGVLGSLMWKPGLLHLCKLPRPLAPYVEAFEQMTSRRSHIWWILFISLVVQFIAVLFSYLAASALGIRLSLLSLCVVIPIVTALTLLPVSVNGLGVREGAHVLLLSHFGVPATQALTLSLVTSAAAFLVSALGGIVYAVRR